MSILTKNIHLACQNHKRRSLLTTLLVLFLFCGTLNIAEASGISSVSDTISDSRPAIGSDHEIKFTIREVIPASGQVIVTFADSFGLTNSLNYQDVDFLINSVNYSVVALPGVDSGSAIGFSASAHTATFTLNGADNLSAGSLLTIKIGQNATFGASGLHQISNPTSLGSHAVRIATYQPGIVPIDQGETLIFILNAIGVSGGVDSTTLTPPSPTPTPTPTPTGGGGAGGGGAAGPTPAALDSKVVAVCGGDLNLDHKVNLVDFSILLYNWGRTVFTNPRVDINFDAKVNLKDLSILLFCWTG